VKYWNAQEATVKSVDGKPELIITMCMDEVTDEMTGENKLNPPFWFVRLVTPMGIATKLGIVELSCPYEAYLMALKNLTRE
jgi:hypothetical protein